jgi:PAS domain S-box-containing protein
VLKATMRTIPNQRNQKKRRNDNLTIEQDTLHESKYRYRRMVEISPEPIVVHSDGILIFLNIAALKLIGASNQEDMIGRSIFDFFHREHQEYIESRLLQVGNEDSHTEFMRHNLIRINGEIIETEISSVEVFNYMGRAVIQSVIRDITTRKRKEEFLRKTDKLSAVGQLAAGVAHEIRNPLTALKGFTQLLKLKHEDNIAYCEIMLTELERINFIVNEFMQLSRPQVANFKQHHLKVLIDNIISLLDAQAILNNVQIIIELEENIPSIYCDENQLKQVFINIMKNAIEAMPNGGNLIIQSKVQNNKILVRFKDQGCGISSEQIPKLGEPFFTTKEKGTGLGLMVSYNIIEVHKGTMFIESELGQGTTINIILPFK